MKTELQNGTTRNGMLIHSRDLTVWAVWVLSLVSDFLLGWALFSWIQVPSLPEPITRVLGMVTFVAAAETIRWFAFWKCADSGLPFGIAKVMFLVLAYLVVLLTFLVFTHDSYELGVHLSQLMLSATAGAAFGALTGLPLNRVASTTH